MNGWCEFCPSSGRCIVCGSVHVNLTPVAASVVPEPDSSEGFVVQWQGVQVRFDRYSDAMIVLYQYPDAVVL